MSVDFLIILFVIAALYASVGHGGASGYLALMGIYGFAPETMKPSALILNLFVAGISFIQFYRSGNFRWQTLLPFIIASIPMAFLGGMLSIDPVWYKRILGVLLIFAVLRLLGIFGQVQTHRKIRWALALIIGASIGFFSGLIGIGGGIILSPVILLLGWADMKQTAAISAAFIWINSLAGLMGIYSANSLIVTDMWQYVLVAVAGGIIGAYLGSFRWNLTILKWCLSLVLLMASIKLMFI
ncbi:MAG: sulfite exporter TauE/SafE family protein [Cyclobacteriaceae bacterium]